MYFLVSEISNSNISEITNRSAETYNCLDSQLYKNNIFECSYVDMFVEVFLYVGIHKEGVPGFQKSRNHGNVKFRPLIQ